MKRLASLFALFVAVHAGAAAAETRVALVTENDDADAYELPPSSVTPEPALFTKPAKPTGPSVALSVNPPSSWMLGSAIAGTMSIGVGKHNAVRLNGAWYKATLGLMDEGDIDGSTADLSIGWQVFPKRVYDGISFEADLLYRRYGALVSSGDYDYDDNTERIALRGQVAYTLYWHPGFIAMGAGLSYGYEYGTSMTTSFVGGDADDAWTDSISRMKVRPEGYVRIGFVIGP